MNFLNWCISVEPLVFQGAQKVLDSVKIWFIGFKAIGFGGVFVALHLLQTFRAKSLKYHEIWGVGLSPDVVQA